MSSVEQWRAFRDIFLAGSVADRIQIIRAGVPASLLGGADKSLYGMIEAMAKMRGLSDRVRTAVFLSVFLQGLNGSESCREGPSQRDCF